MKEKTRLLIIISIVCCMGMIVSPPSSAQFLAYSDVYVIYYSQAHYQPYENMPYQTNIFYRDIAPFGSGITPYSTFPFNIYNPDVGYPSVLTRGPFSSFFMPYNPWQYRFFPQYLKYFQQTSSVSDEDGA